MSIKKLIFPFGIIFSLVSNTITTNIKQELTLTYPTSTGKYIVKNDKYTLEVNKSDLSFNISDGNNIFNSYYFDDSDTSLKTNTAKNFFKSAIITTYIYQNSSTSRRDLLDSTRRQETLIGFKGLDDGFIGDIILFDLGINFQLHVKLTSYGLNVSIPFEYIKEDNDKEKEEIIGKLKSISIYPGLEMSFGTINNGYSFIPDGSGAIIDYVTPKKSKRSYEEKVYGNDLALKENKTNKTSPNNLNLGMYSLNYNNNTTICNIVSGEEYASLFSTASGINNNYNYSYFTYNYRDTYLKQLNADGSKTISTYQEKMNEFDISQDYIFSSYLNPSEMTLKYRSYLENKNLLPSKEDKSNLRLTYLMNENRNSMFGKEVIELTTPNNVLENQQKLNVNKTLINYLGYSKNGLTNSYTNLLPTHQNKSEYITVNDKLKKLGNTISFDVNYNSVFKSSNINGKHLARNINEKYIELSNKEDNSLEPYYLLNLSTSKNNIKEDENKFVELNADTINFNSIPNLLYSSFYGNDIFSLTTAKKEYQEIFLNYKLKKSMSKPNGYLFKYLSNYTDAPISNSGYLIETSSFPFFSMLLSDLVPLYSNYINLNYLGKKQLLRLIDYRIAPSYLLTNKDSIELFDTNSKNIFTSKFSSWEENILYSYNMYSKAYANIADAKFISHIEENNLSINTFDNDYSLIINYSDKDVHYKGIVVPSLDFKEVKL